MVQGIRGVLVRRGIKRVQHLQAGFCDKDSYDAPVLSIFGSPDQGALRQSVYETSDIGVSVYHAIADLGACPTCLGGSAEDAEKIVAAWGYVGSGLEKPLPGFLKSLSRKPDIDVDLFLQGYEWF